MNTPVTKLTAFPPVVVLTDQALVRSQVTVQVFCFRFYKPPSVCFMAGWIEADDWPNITAMANDTLRKPTFVALMTQ